MWADSLATGQPVANPEPMPPDTEPVDDLAATKHVPFDQGANVRNNRRIGHFLLSRPMAPGTDTQQFDFDGLPLETAGPAVYLERLADAQLSRSRPGIVAWVHSRSHSIVPRDVAQGSKRQAVFHLADFIGTRSGGATGRLRPPPDQPTKKTRETNNDCRIRHRPIAAA